MVSVYGSSFRKECHLPLRLRTMPMPLLWERAGSVRQKGPRIIAGSRSGLELGEVSLSTEKSSMALGEWQVKWAIWLLTRKGPCAVVEERDALRFMLQLQGSGEWLWRLLKKGREEKYLKELEVRWRKLPQRRFLRQPNPEIRPLKRSLMRWGDSSGWDWSIPFISL